MEKDILQAPWTPVTCKQEKDQITVNVWGREYTFCDSFFPSTISTAKADILASPIKLHAFFDGVEKEIKDTKYLEVESDNAACEFSVAQVAGNVVFNSRVRVEYDGLIRVKFCVIPFWNEEWTDSGREEAVYRLDKLYFDIPVKKEFAGLYHYYPAGDSTIYVHNDTLPSGTMPEKGIEIPFKPYSWLGWEEGGLSICCESDQNLELSDKNNAIEYIVEKDTVTYRVHLLDHMPKAWKGNKEMWADAAIPIQFEYGIEATPVKPHLKNRLTSYQIYHMDATSVEVGNLFAEFEESEEKGRELIKSIADNGAQYFLILGWTDIQNYWKAADEEKFKRFVEICHEYGLEPMLYFGYEYATILSDWYEKSDNYCQKNTEGRLTDGWLMKPPLPWHRAYTICWNGDYGDKFIEGIAYAMDTYGVKGIYLDGTYNFWECANEEHGCGYRDTAGKLHHTYPIFAVRDIVKRIYKVVHDRGGIIELHQSSTCTVPTVAFSDLSITGENVQAQFRKNHKFLKFDAFRAEYTGINTGLNTQFAALEKDGVYLPAFVAVTLPHGIMPMPRLKVKGNLEYMGKIWAAHHEFGIDKADWRPYWSKDCPVSANKSDVYVSVYEKDDAYMAVVSSINDDDVKVRLTVNGSVSSAKSMLPDNVCEKVGSNIEVTLAPYKVALIQINK